MGKYSQTVQDAPLHVAPFPGHTSPAPSLPSPPTLTPARTLRLDGAFIQTMVWWIYTRTSVTGGFVSHCVIPRMDVTTSAGPNIVRNVKCTPSLKIVTESEEP